MKIIKKRFIILIKSKSYANIDFKFFFNYNNNDQYIIPYHLLVHPLMMYWLGSVIALL